MGEVESPQGPSASRRPAQPTVILRLEVMKDQTSKSIVLGLWVTGAISLAFLAWTTAAKFHEDQSYFLRNTHLQQVSVAFASVCLAATLLTLGTLCHALLWVLRHGLRWEGPRRRAVAIVAGALLLQTTNLGLWMANMIVTWTSTCSWFDRSVDIMACVQWTIWNCLFYLNIVQASLLLPTGAWQAVAETTRSRTTFWWRRCFGGGGGAGDEECSTKADGGKRSAMAGGDDASDAGAGCGVKDAAAAALHSTGRHAANGTAVAVGAASSAVVAVGTAAHAAAAGLSVLPGAAAVQGRAAAVAGMAAPAAAGATSAAGAVAGAAVKLEERIRLSLMAVMLLLVWLPNQVLIIVLTTTIVGLRQWEWNGQTCYNPSDPACVPPNTPCTDWAWQCQPEGSWLHLTYGVGALFLATALCFLLLTWVAYHQLAARPYRDWRVRNLALRIILRTRVAAYLLFVLTLVLTFYTRMASCSSVLLVWLGLGPMQVAMTATVVAETVYFMPVREPDAAVVKLHDALQRFAWTEAEVPALVADRGFPEEPAFCVETALKCLYLSLHAYSRSKPGEPTDMATALRLYGLRHFEWLREPVHDSNCLLAWGPDVLVVAFRGTDSLANIKADIKVWRTAHPPLRGTQLLGRRPLVHKGFLASWLFKGYNTQVLQRIREILEGRNQHSALTPCDFTSDRCCVADATPDARPPAAAEAEQRAAWRGGDTDGIGAGGGGGTSRRRRGRPFRILVTGHSLGGAMGTLCAIDLAKALPGWGLDAAPALLPLPAGVQPRGGSPLDGDTPLPHPAVSLSVYTFGAPRTGNHAFAHDFDTHVPDCWSVINGQDVVANRGKLWVLFKRQGKPVLLSRRGDVIVRPSAIEQSAHTTSGASVRAHFLQDSYAHSLAVFLALQLAGLGKAMPGGHAAVAAMRADPAVSQVLERVVRVDAVHAARRSVRRSRRREAGSDAGRDAVGDAACKTERENTDGSRLAPPSVASLDV